MLQNNAKKSLLNPAIDHHRQHHSASILLLHFADWTRHTPSRPCHAETHTNSSAKFRPAESCTGCPTTQFSKWDWYIIASLWVCRKTRISPINKGIQLPIKKHQICYLDVSEHAVYCGIFIYIYICSICTYIYIYIYIILYIYYNTPPQLVVIVIGNPDFLDETITYVVLTVNWFARNPLPSHDLGHSWLCAVSRICPCPRLGLCWILRKHGTRW